MLVSPARYIVRFDDLCPTMDWVSWRQVEHLLDERGVKPIVAVVPDNHDPELEVEPPRLEFWSQVRAWQSKGWTIGLHGYQHVYDTSHAGLLRLHARSEFAGHSPAEQLRRLTRALAIFDSNGVRADMWVAPSNSFDRTTLSVLSALGTTVISGGYYHGPRKDDLGMIWVPQQLWQFRWRPFGLWTVCMHHNRWRRADVDRLARDLDRYSNQLTSVPAILRAREIRFRSPGDVLFSEAYRAAGRSRHALRTCWRLAAPAGGNRLARKAERGG